MRLFLFVLLGIFTCTRALASGLWLKGDFHVHSLHSTDAKDSPVATVLSKAEDVGFDFISLTDHDNHVEGKITSWFDPDYRSSKLVLLYGVEWTTGKGHANIFGTAPFDYNEIWQLRDQDIPRTLDIVHNQNLHFSVNHPAAKDLWEPGFELPVDSTEVWTAVFGIPNNNRKAIEIWDGVLKGGRRLTARGGSDSHHQKDFESQLFNIGNPTTWVFARNRSGEAILEALKAGRVSLSYAPKAERIELYADENGDGSYTAAIGSNISVSENQNLRFRVQIAGIRSGTNYEIQIFKNGLKWQTQNTRSGSIEFQDQVQSLERVYYRVEVRGSTPDAPFLSALAFDRFIGMTNPIFINYPEN